MRQSPREFSVNTKSSWVLVLLLTGALSIAATAPVAMRVEVEPLRQTGGNTEVAIIVQIAPMDRARIGSNAIVRIELDEGRVSSGSPMRAVRVEDDGSFQVVVEWPPGEHDLRVVVEDPNKEDSGLWVGKVRIPDLGRGATAREIDEPESDPDPVPEKTDQATAEPAPAPEPKSVPEPEMPEPRVNEPVVAVDETSTETAPEPSTSEAPASAGSAAAGAAVMSDAPAPATPVEPEVAQTNKPEPAPEPEVAEQPAAEVEPEPEPEPETREPPGVEPEPVPAPEPEVAEQPAAEVEPEPEPEPETAEPPGAESVPEPEKKAPPLVEPLRADPPQRAAEPEAAAPSGPAEPGSAAIPVSADLAARFDEWERADPDTREFSAIMLRGREPAKNVDVPDLRLRIGGSEVPVERLGDAENAPLLLGLAVDVAPEEVDGWSGMQGSLAPIVDRAGGGRGRLFVAKPSGVGDWDAGPGSPGRSAGTQAPMNVARLVMASLENFEGRRGRTFLVVLTDGRNEPSKEEWRQATDSAGAAGVPILVIALWDDEFSQRTRKNLKKLTVVSGGSLFLVQGRAQLESAADRFGRYLDGGYSLRFRPPTAAQDTITAVSVSATDRTIDISAPKSIR
jgi:hypothetical protein